MGSPARVGGVVSPSGRHRSLTSRSVSHAKRATLHHARGGGGSGSVHSVQPRTQGQWHSLDVAGRERTANGKATGVHMTKAASIIAAAIVLFTFISATNSWRDRLQRQCVAYDEAMGNPTDRAMMLYAVLQQDERALTHQSII